jgi:hypothetical protein
MMDDIIISILDDHNSGKLINLKMIIESQRDHLTNSETSAQTGFAGFSFKSLPGASAIFFGIKCSLKIFKSRSCL